MQRVINARARKGKFRGRSCPYFPCAAKSRETVFTTWGGWIKHRRSVHPEVEKRFAEEEEFQTTRQKVFGGIRHLTESVLKDAGMTDEARLARGQRALDLRTEEECQRLHDYHLQHDRPPSYPSRTTNLAASGSFENRNIDGLATRNQDTEDGGHQSDKADDFEDEYVPVPSKLSRPCESKRPGLIYGTIPDENAVFPVERNIFYPFDNAWDFKLGAWLTRGNLTTSHIIRGFNGGIIQQVKGKYTSSLTSSKKLNDKLDLLEPDFGEKSWKCGKAHFWADGSKSTRTYHYRDPVLIIKHLMKQPAYDPFLVYEPVVERNAKGDRIYSELNSGTWWAEKQRELPLGATLVPVLFTSDETRLSTHVGTHSFWPLYMSIGNIHSSIRNKPTNNCWILVAQLPIPPSCKKFKEATDAETRALDRRAQKEGRSDEWKKIKRGNSAHDKDGVTRAEYERIFQKMKANALGCVIRDIFAPLGSYTSASTGIDLECADGNRRRGFPVVAGWLADFQEYNKLYTTTTNGCCLCEVSPAQLGDNFIASRRCWKRHTEALQTRSWLKDRQLLLNRASDDPSFHQLCVDREELMFPARKQDLTKEKTKISKQITLADTYFEARQSKPIDNALWKTGVADMADAWKPDLLHTIYEGMFSHLLTVLQPFLYEHRRLGRFEEAWMRVPAFEGISAPKRSLFEEDQRTGKAMRENLRRILPTLVVALADPNIQEAFPFYECIAATRYLVDFSLICTYQFHTETSLGYLKTYLEGFHKHKHVFDTHRPTPRADKQKNVVHEGESDPNQRFREMEPGVDKEKQDLESRREIAKERAKKARNQLQLDAKRIMESGDMEKLKAWLGECDGEDGDEVWRFEPEAILKEIDRIATNIEARYLDHGACWKIPKLHLLSHFIETIEKFGYLQQYSSEIGETLHKGIKEAYRHSNKRDETKQILQFHTRRFAIRMRELNLLHLARQQQHEEDIQEALSLYADKRDKLLVAKLNREGKGSIRDTGYFEEKLQALRLDEAEADINVPHTDAPISLHNAIPLFGDKVVERVGHTLKSRVRAAGFKTVADVSKSYEIPKLTDAILHFLCTEKQEEYGAAGLAPEHLEDVRTEVFHSLIITDRPAQTGGALVSYRADCKGPGFRNDSVAYIDEEGDDYSIEVEERRNHGAGEDHDSCSMEIDMVKRKELGTDFGNVRVGFLQCILRLQMPLPQYLDRFKIAGASICGPEQCGVIDVVYLDPLQPVRYDMFGEMIPGAFIAKCCWPKKTKATKKWKEPPPCTVRRRNGGLVISIDSVLKNVQLLPVHGRDVVNRSQQAWLVNNRIDLHCWDILYAKKLERDENTFGIEGIVG